MKKRFSTRLLSVFLAVMMVVTSIPFTALTASAATSTEIYDGLDAEFKSHQVGFFFSDASTDPKYDKISGTNKLSGSGATWDSAEGGFRFNGNNADHLYIKASDILGNVTSETGFTIHFEAKSLSNDWQRYFDFMCSEPLGTGDTYYLCATPNGGGKVCVKHSDGASGYFEMEQIDGMNTSDGQWHTYTIAVSNSTVEVWVDGKAYASKQDGLIDSAWFNKMRDNGYIRFGISAFSNDPAYDGWMKNVHIYDVAYTEPAYLFAYFVGDDDQADAVNQRVRFALSKDGVNFTSINGNAPILKNDQVSGTITWNNKTGMAHTKGVRDPFIIKKVNEAGYFVVATDLRVGANGGSYNNSKIVVWDINDLSKADKAIPWVVETSGMFGSTYYSGSTIDKDYIAWAPEVTYDYQNNIYMMYWSGPLYNNSTILCAYTRDFKIFYQDAEATKTIDGNTYKPKTLFSESGKNVIDADIVFDGSNYYMVYKRESEKQLYFVKASTIDGITSQAGTKFVDSRYTGASGNGAGLEGPELYKNADGKWTLIADNYTENTGAGSKGVFVMYQVDSLDEFMTGADCSSKSVTTNISDCSPRHGSVTTISSGVYASLNKEYGGVSDAEGSLVARYFTTDNLTEDTSGNDYSATVSSGISYVSKFEGVENCAFFDATTSNTSNNNPIYAKIRTDQMYAKYNFNFADGVTFTWKSYDLLPKGNDGYTGLVSVTQGDKKPAYIGLENTDTYSHYDNAYAFVLGGLCNGISSGTVPPSKAECESYGHTEYLNTVLGNQWVDYKMVFTGRGYKVYRNGEVVVNAGVNKIDETWYSHLFSNGTIILGSTFFDNDCNFRGYISDFRIYATGNQDSVANLEKEIAIQDELKAGEEAKTYITDNINNGAKTYTFNTTIHNADTNYMNNIIYSKNFKGEDNFVINDFSDSTSTKNNFKVHGPEFAVALYSGSGTDIRFPLVAENNGGGNKTGVTGYLGIDYLSFNNGKFGVGGATWTRCEDWNNLTANTDTSHDFSSSSSTNISRPESSANQRFYVKDKKFWKNYMKYTGTGNTTDYYDLLTNPSYSYQADYTWSWSSWGKPKWGSKSNHQKTIPTKNYNLYVINYEPLKNFINTTLKNDFNSVKNNEWMYDETSLAKYYLYVQNVLKFDLKDTKNDYTTDAGIKNVASTMKGLITNYSLPTKKKFNVDFTFANGSVVTKTINAGDTLSGIIPANTKAVYNDNKLSHMSYTWSEGCEASQMPTSDEAYFEVFAANECSFEQNTTTYPTCEGAGLAEFTCSVCGGKYDGTVPALGHAWSSTYTSNSDNKGTHRQVCQNDNSHILDTPCNMVVESETDTQTVMICDLCGYKVTTIKLDRTAYNNAVAAARAVILNETAKYSADSLKALQAVLNQAATDSLNVETQDALNEITARINTANQTTANGGVLVANTFRITYGNLFDYNEFMNSDSKNISNPDWGTIDFDIANQVFTVIGNGTYNDVYSDYNRPGTYKIDVSDSTSYTFEYTAKGTIKNQAFVFFYDENGTPINLDENYKYLYNGTEMAGNSDQYFVCKYETPDGGTTKLTFTPPAGTVSVDFRFGVTLGSESCDFKKIAFYETSKADSFIVADDVVYGSSFDEIAISTPDVDGMHFGGWFTDKECRTSVSTIGTITQNINLHAKLDPYVEKKKVGCTLINNGYTVYVCSDENCSSTGEYKAYDDKLLDGTTNGYWNAYNNLVAIVTAEEGNGYENYTEASVKTVKSAYEALHTTACASYKQSEVDGYANDMKAIINQLVVKVNFVVKQNGGVDKTVTQEIPYKGALEAQPVDNYTTVDGRYTWTFSSWDKDIVTSNITTGATYTAQYTSTDNLDRSAYDAAVASAEASIANTAKYTEASRNALKAVLDSRKIDENTTQATVEDYTTAIQTAISELALSQYTVELYYVINDGTPQKQEDQTYTKDYGTLVVLNAPKDGYFVEKWVRAELLEDGTDGKEYPVNSTSNKVSYTTNSNSKYYVYLKSTTASTDETQSTIFLKGRNGKTLSSAYVVTGTEYKVTVSGSKITVNGQTMTAPVIPFYNFNHFEMNGATLQSGNMTFNENVEIQAVYEAAHTQYTITLEGDCTGQSTAYYDEKVVITATNGNENTVWYIVNNGSYQVCGYGPTYTFRASRDITIKCENNEVVAQPSVTVTRLTYGGIREKTITAQGSFYLPEGYTLVKTGVRMKTSVVNDRTAVDNYNNYIGTGTAPAKEFVAENYVKDTKQFAINVYSAKDRTQIYIGAVGFLTYKDKDNIERTVYSDLVIEDWQA